MGSCTSVPVPDSLEPLEVGLTNVESVVVGISGKTVPSGSHSGPTVPVPENDAPTASAAAPSPESPKGTPKLTLKEKRALRRKVILEGHMYKRSKNVALGERLRYMVLKGGGDLSYYQSKEDYEAKKIAKGTFNIVCFVKEASEALQVEIRDGVRVTATLKTDEIFQLRTLNVEDCERLCAALQGLNIDKPFIVHHTTTSVSNEAMSDETTRTAATSPQSGSTSKSDDATDGGVAAAEARVKQPDPLLRLWS
jgi:hypothetical protein